MTQPKPQPARHGGGWWGKWRHRKEIAGAIRDAIRRHGAPLPIALSLPLTPRARRALELAKAEAQRKYHEYVGTEHLLTGLVTEGSGIAAIAMRDLGVKLEQVQEQTEQLVARGPSPVAAPLLTPRSRKAIETGDQLAHRLGHDFLGTEHLLLGLLADVDGVATQVLLNLRVSIDALQSRTLSLMGKADVTIERLDGPVRACMNFWPSGTGKKVSLGGISWSFIATAAETGGAYAMFELRITSESTPPTLVLHRADLGIFVTTGEVAVDVGERAVSAAAGAFLHVPRGVKFSLRATTTAAAANAVVIASPAGFERFLAQVCDHPAAELDKLREIAKEHGIEVRNATAS
jgi:hypothetical protein